MQRRRPIALWREWAERRRAWLGGLDWRSPPGAACKRMTGKRDARHVLALALLLIPFTSAHGQPVADHLKCYKVKDSRPKASYTADLGGLVPEPGCRIKVPAKLFVRRDGQDERSALAARRQSRESRGAVRLLHCEVSGDYPTHGRLAGPVWRRHLDTEHVEAPVCTGSPVLPRCR